MRKAIVIGVSWASSLLLAGLYLLIGQGINQLFNGYHLTVIPWMLIFAVGIGIMVTIGNWVASSTLPVTEHRLRKAVIRNVFALGITERSRERTGRIVSTATDGVERAANYQAIFIAPMIASMTTPILVLILVGIALDPLSAWILAIVIPLIPLCVGSFQRAFKTVSRQYREASRQLAAQELDAIQGLSTLKLLNAGKNMGAQLRRAAESVRLHVMRLLGANQLVLFVVDAIFSLGMITGAIILALHRYIGGALNGGQALSLVLISSILLEPLDRIGQFFYVGMGGIASKREIRDFLAEKPMVIDSENVQIPQENRYEGEDSPSAPSIDLDNVTFAYAKSMPVITHATIHIKPGEHIALTGASGSGKTTIAALVQARLRPLSGVVKINGHDLRDVPLEWVRSMISVVEQDTYLFTGTLRDNLLIAKKDATDSLLLDVLDKARLSDFFDSLPQGLDTQVGEKGMSLSGGEAQRVAIARALLKDAPILILDEPTAHVDLISEKKIIEALEVAALGRTTVTISHRQFTIAASGRRVELKGGMLV